MLHIMVRLYIILQIIDITKSESACIVSNNHSIPSLFICLFIKCTPIPKYPIVQQRFIVGRPSMNLCWRVWINHISIVCSNIKTVMLVCLNTPPFPKQWTLHSSSTTNWNISAEATLVDRMKTWQAYSKSSGICENLS